MSKRNALSNAINTPPGLPPGLKRGKDIELSSGGAETLEAENAIEQKGNDAQPQESTDATQQNSLPANGQASSDAIDQKSEIAKTQKDEKAIDQQSKDAGISDSENVEKQESEMVVQQKSEKVSSEETEMQIGEMTPEQMKDLAVMLQRFYASSQKREEERKQKIDPADLLIRALADTSFSQYLKMAETQKSKVTQGMMLPEALFAIYTDCSYELKKRGKKTTKADLMAKALIKYLIEDILPELAEETD
jgi:hypothetical protein